MPTDRPIIIPGTNTLITIGLPEDHQYDGKPPAGARKQVLIEAVNGIPFETIVIKNVEYMTLDGKTLTVRLPAQLDITIE